MQYVANGLVAAAIYLAVAIALGIVFQVNRRLDLSLAGLLVLAPYATSVFSPSMSSFLAAVVASILIGLGAIALEWLVFAPLRRRGAGPTTGLLVSLGLLMVMQNSLLIGAGPERRAIVRRVVAEGHLILGARLTTVQVGMLALAAAFATLLFLVLRWTKHGIQIRAVIEDPELATITGVHLQGIQLGAAGSAGFLVGVMGVMIGFDTGYTPFGGLQPVLVAVAIVLVGQGNVLFLSVSAVAVGLGQNVLVIWLGSEWTQTSALLLLLILLSIGRGRLQLAHGAS